MSNEAVLECEQCKISFAKSKELKLHLDNHLPWCLHSRGCHNCHIIIASKGKFERHCSSKTHQKRTDLLKDPKANKENTDFVAKERLKFINDNKHNIQIVNFISDILKRRKESQDLYTYLNFLCTRSLGGSTNSSSETIIACSNLDETTNAVAAILPNSRPDTPVADELEPVMHPDEGAAETPAVINKLPAQIPVFQPIRKASEIPPPSCSTPATGVKRPAPDDDFLKLQAKVVKTAEQQTSHLKDFITEMLQAQEASIKAYMYQIGQSVQNDIQRLIDTVTTFEEDRQKEGQVATQKDSDIAAGLVALSSSLISKYKLPDNPQAMNSGAECMSPSQYNNDADNSLTNLLNLQ